MKLCEFCKSNVLEKGVAWDYHHSSYASLASSAEWTVQPQADSQGSDAQQQKVERCLFCSRLKQDVDNLPEDFKKGGNQEGWPLYRWNIRSLARIHESLECVIVTFRWVPREGKSLDEVDITVPTRTFYLFEQEGLGRLPSIKDLGHTTNPWRSGGHSIKNWVSTCSATHTDCQKHREAAESHKTAFVPTRLLDISGPAESDMRVVETKVDRPTGPYVSLSHCWGEIPFVKLTPQTFIDFTTRGVPWTSMTRNFRDAVEIARFLKVNYIWIDSLCIIQGEDGDWSSEASKMHHVYRNSYCNIAIVDAADSTGGAFRERNPEDVALVRFRAEKNLPMFSDKPWRVVSQDLWETELLSTSLYKRGWVFQERMLAPRILHFAQQQIFWDCPSLSACESIPAGLPQPIDHAAGQDRHWRGRLQAAEESDEPLAGAKDDSIESFWKAAVAAYTNCMLTKGSDKLIAMWGVAKLVRDATDIQYGNGLWEKNLADQLAWRVKDCTLDARPSYSKEEALTREIPTWSWASMDGAIEVPDRMTDRPHYTIRDHNGRPLAFDLKGVARRTEPQRLGDRPTPVQQRGMSDSVVELQKRYSETAGSNVQELSRDEPPKFYTETLLIQGHVGRGTLHYDEVAKKWRLEVPGMLDEEVEAHPDTIPKAIDMEPYFLVLSAKQVFKFTEESIASPDPEKLAQLEVADELGEYVEPEDLPVQASEIVVDGVGILLKDVGNHHFHRTGALSFRNLGFDAFKKLLITHRGTELTSEYYSAEFGRKLWLD